jgi:hypothetical protein
MAIELLSVRKIWDAAPHCAFTDLAYYSGAWFCAFREGESHALSIGRVRVLRSPDGEGWESAALIAEEGIDLRDPHFSVDGAGRLELTMGGTALVEGSYVGRRPRVSRSADGRRWSVPRTILAEGDWLWRATRRGEAAGVGGDAAPSAHMPEADTGAAYGVTYRLPKKRKWTVHLMGSAEGLEWEELADLRRRGLPNEATVRFAGDGRAVVLLRREAGRARALIGESAAPFRRWKWRKTSERVGGPNFVILGNGERWAACRFIADRKARTAVARMTDRALEPLLDLPSGGDCGYPGLVHRNGILWISYYSSHEGGAARIYLAKARLG